MWTAEQRAREVAQSIVNAGYAAEADGYRLRIGEVEFSFYRGRGRLYIDSYPIRQPCSPNVIRRCVEFIFAEIPAKLARTRAQAKRRSLLERAKARAELFKLGGVRFDDQHDEIARTELMAVSMLTLEHGNSDSFCTLAQLVKNPADTWLYGIIADSLEDCGAGKIAEEVRKLVEDC